MSDYGRLIKRMRNLVKIKAYSPAVKEAGAILETLLKDLYMELLKGLPTNRKEEVLTIEKEIGQGKSIESLNFGQLIGIFTKAKLFDDLSEKRKTRLQYFTPENLNHVNELRNKCTHKGFEPAQHEVDYVESDPLPIVKTKKWGVFGA